MDEVVGSFVIDFDADAQNRTDGITLSSSNLALGSPISFSYDVSEDNLIVGGLEVGSNGLNFGAEDFVLTITGATGSSPQFFSFLYVSPQNADPVIQGLFGFRGVGGRDAAVAGTPAGQCLAVADGARRARSAAAFEEVLAAGRWSGPGHGVTDGPAAALVGRGGSRETRCRRLSDPGGAQA